MDNITGVFRQEPKCIEWERSLLNAGCIIHELRPLYLYHRSNGELLFALLHANVETPEGNLLPPIIFLRGHACIVVPLVINKETGQRGFCMVCQRRIGNGIWSVEFPAGMLDRSVDSPVAVGVQELHEETGIMVEESQLFSLHDKKLYSSTGACDEAIYYYGCVISLDQSTFQALSQRQFDNTTEHEHIKVTIIPFDSIASVVTSGQALLALYLFRDYCEKNSIIYK